MSKQQLFNSKTDPIPEIRRDLQIIPIKENGSSFLYFHDERGYATSDLALRQDVRPLLSLINGQKSINDLEPHLGEEVTKDQVLEFIQFLDKHRLLASKYFKHHAKEIEYGYEQSSVHSSVTAGSSYPADPKELEQYLDEAFAGYSGKKNAPGSAKALYAPHIDPRVAIESYVDAFAPIKDLQPKRVVIIATSHYAGLFPELYKENPFILVNRDFDLPLGKIRRDSPAIDELLQTDPEIGITAQDRAHRMEHSIELHLLFLSYLWDHNFQIVPFLTRGLDDLYYMKDGHLGRQLDNFSEIMQKHFVDDEETFFLISGDLAHFGNKFGDKVAASTMFDRVEDFDRKFLDYASANRRAELLELMKEDMDPYRICGFPPIYTFLNTMPDLKGEILSYDMWDERERESAVTFGSILYEQNKDRAD